jgi:cell division protein FtsB
MIMLAALYQKGGTQSELAPRFAEARDLIREIKDLNDQEYINKASKYWNNLVDIHDDLAKALK